MKASASRNIPAEAPARAAFWPVDPVDPWSGLRTEKLELISRGDLVSGVRVRGAIGGSDTTPDRPGLLLLVHDAAASACSLDWSPVSRWIARDPRTIAAAVDLPLHGHRASPKLSERLIAAFASLATGRPLDANAEILVEEFLGQSVHDLRRTLDALLRLGEIDPKRIGLLGLGLGARVADSLLADESRLSAAVLVRTQRAPAQPAREAAAKSLDIDATGDGRDWANQAERFFASRIGL